MDLVMAFLFLAFIGIILAMICYSQQPRAVKG